MAMRHELLASSFVTTNQLLVLLESTGSETCQRWIVAIGLPLTITVLVNGLAVDVNTAKSNDTISIKVSIPYSKIAWTTSTQFMTSSTIVSDGIVMLRQ